MDGLLLRVEVGDVRAMKALCDEKWSVHRGVGEHLQDILHRHGVPARRKTLFLFSFQIGSSACYLKPKDWGAKDRECVLSHR
jgi:hypothetical protein